MVAPKKSSRAKPVTKSRSAPKAARSTTKARPSASSSKKAGSSASARKTTGLTAKQKAQLTAKKAKLREQIKLLGQKQKAAQKELDKLLPPKKRSPIRGLVKAAKNAASEGLQKAIDSTKPAVSKRVTAPAVASRAIKPIEFIDGLCSTKTYLIVSEKRDNKAIRLGVRHTEGDYRLHFYPNIAAHMERLPGMPHGTVRLNKGYETIWVQRPLMLEVLANLQQRSDTNFLPQQLVDTLVDNRDKMSAEQALATA